MHRNRGDRDSRAGFFCTLQPGFHDGDANRERRLGSGRCSRYRRNGGLFVRRESRGFGLFGRLRRSFAFDRERRHSIAGMRNQRLGHYKRLKVRVVLVVVTELSIAKPPDVTLVVVFDVVEVRIDSARQAGGPFRR